MKIKFTARQKRKFSSLGKIILALAIFLPNIAPISVQGQTPASEVEFSPAIDGFINYFSANSSFQSTDAANELKIKRLDSKNDSFRAYLRFNLTTLPADAEILSAKLIVNYKRTLGTSIGNVYSELGAYRVDGAAANWTGFNGAAAKTGAYAIGDLISYTKEPFEAVEGPATIPFEWDLTSYITQNKQYTVALGYLGEDMTHAIFLHNRRSAAPPKLIVRYSDANSPVRVDIHGEDEVARGGATTFTAAAFSSDDIQEGVNQEVKWYIDGATAGAAIDESTGELRVSRAVPAGSVIRIKAVSARNSDAYGTKDVSVVNSDIPVGSTYVTASTNFNRVNSAYDSVEDQYIVDLTGGFYGEKLTSLIVNTDLDSECGVPVNHDEPVAMLGENGALAYASAYDCVFEMSAENAVEVNPSALFGVNGNYIQEMLNRFGKSVRVTIPLMRETGYGDPLQILIKLPGSGAKRPKLIGKGDYKNSLEAATKFVDASYTAEDGNGTAERPYKTIRQAIDGATPGDVITVAPGIYRETLTISNSGSSDAKITLQSSELGGAVLNGAKPFAAAEWTEEDTPGVYSAEWTTDFFRGAGNNRNYNQASRFNATGGYAENVVWNDNLLVMRTNLSALEEGSFYVDWSEDNRRLYVRLPGNKAPGDGEVESAIYGKGLSVDADHWNIKGFACKNYANFPQAAAIDSRGSYNSFEDILVKNCTGVGIGFGVNRGIDDEPVYDNAFIRCVADSCGQLGWKSLKSKGAQILDCTTVNNNFRFAAVDWEAGGTKFTRGEDTLIDGFVSYNNCGRGVWFDIDNKNCTVSNCIIFANYGFSNPVQGTGLFYEISYGPYYFIDNLIYSNSGAGIMIGESTGESGAVISGNTIVDCMYPIHIRLVANRMNANVVPNIPWKIDNVAITANKIKNWRTAAIYAEGQNLTNKYFENNNITIEGNIFDTRDKTRLIMQINYQGAPGIKRFAINNGAGVFPTTAMPDDNVEVLTGGNPAQESIPTSMVMFNSTTNLININTRNFTDTVRGKPLESEQEIQVFRRDSEFAGNILSVYDASSPNEVKFKLKVTDENLKTQLLSDLPDYPSAMPYFITVKVTNNISGNYAGELLSIRGYNNYNISMFSEAALEGIAIEGENMLRPSGGNIYTAIAYNERDEVMENRNIVWSLERPVEGVTMDGGVVNIDSGVKESSFIIKAQDAENPSVYRKKQVDISHFEVYDVTSRVTSDNRIECEIEYANFNSGGDKNISLILAAYDGAGITDITVKEVVAPASQVVETLSEGLPTNNNAESYNLFLWEDTNSIKPLHKPVGMAANFEPGSAEEEGDGGIYSVIENPALKNVLLLGDSISIGYHFDVVDALAGKANVYRPYSPGNSSVAVNCADSGTGVANIRSWLGSRRWDIIHFNWGLHDLKRLTPGMGTESDDPSMPPVNDINQYAENLQQLVNVMKETGAKLIFAATTPYPQGVKPCRLPEDAISYNNAAIGVMQSNGVEINDLYALALPKLSTIQQPVNVHFKPEGSKFLGGAVADVINEALKDGLYREYTYKKDLKLGVFTPENPMQSNPTIVLVHGGGWTGGELKNMYNQCEYFKNLGFVAITVDYTLEAKTGQIATLRGIQDVCDALEFVKDNAVLLKADIDKLVVGGGSAGGHLALTTAMENITPALTARPKALVLFNPVTDTVDGFGKNRFTAAYGNSISPYHQMSANGIVPTVILHGDADTVVPLSQINEFATRATNRGSVCQVVAYAGQEHSFFNQEPHRTQTLQAAETFLNNIGFYN